MGEVRDGYWYRRCNIAEQENAELRKYKQILDDLLKWLDQYDFGHLNVGFKDMEPFWKGIEKFEQRLAERSE